MIKKIEINGTEHFALVFPFCDGMAEVLSLRRNLAAICHSISYTMPADFTMNEFEPFMQLLNLMEFSKEDGENLAIGSQRSMIVEWLAEPAKIFSIELSKF